MIVLTYNMISKSELEDLFNSLTSYMKKLFKSKTSENLFDFINNFEYHNLLKNIISKNKIDIRYDDEQKKFITKIINLEELDIKAELLELHDYELTPEYLNSLEKDKIITTNDIINYNKGQISQEKEEKFKIKIQKNLLVEKFNKIINIDINLESIFNFIYKKIEKVLRIIYKIIFNKKLNINLKNINNDNNENIDINRLLNDEDKLLSIKYLIIQYMIFYMLFYINNNTGEDVYDFLVNLMLKVKINLEMDLKKIEKENQKNYNIINY